MSLRICNAEGEKSSRWIPGYPECDRSRCSYFLWINREDGRNNGKVYYRLSVSWLHLHDFVFESTHPSTQCRYWHWYPMIRLITESDYQYRNDSSPEYRCNYSNTSRRYIMEYHQYEWIWECRSLRKWRNPSNYYLSYSSKDGRMLQCCVNEVNVWNSNFRTWEWRGYTRIFLRYSIDCVSIPWESCIQESISPYLQ